MTAVTEAIRNSISIRLGWTLAAFLWQGALVAALFGGVTALLARASAAIRYAAGCAALLAMLLWPIATFLSRGDHSGEPAAFTAGTPVSASASEQVGRAAGAIFAARSLLQPFRSGLAALLPWLPLLWFAGILVLSLRYVGGWTVARRLTRRGVSSPPAPVAVAFDRLRERLGACRTVVLLQSAAVAVPTALGAFKPVVLLPLSTLTGLSPEGLEAVLAHELAHIRRRDYLVNLLQTVVETLLFYHPAVWWVSRRVRIERENCCDDLAVEATGDVGAYARALVSLEQIRASGPRLAVAASGGTLLARIARLLPAPAPARQGTSWVGIVLALAAVATLGAATGLPAAIDNHAQIAGGISKGVSAAAADSGAPVPDVPDATPTAGPPAAGRPFPPEELGELARHGVTTEFLRALAALGYEKASLDDLVSPRVHGVTPEYITAMTSLLGKLSLEELASLRTHGVTPDFVRSFKNAGYADISADAALSLRIHGVTPEAAAEWPKLLGGRPSLDAIVSARIHGANPEFGKEMRTLGIEFDIDSLVSMRIHGVTPDFAREIGSLGSTRLSADELISLRVHGVTADFVRQIQALGYRNVALDELTSLKIHGVTPEFIRDANRSASARLTIDEILDRRIHRRNR